MVTTKQALTTTWTNIATDVNYLAQVLEGRDSIVLFKASVASPADTSGSVELAYRESISHILLDGNIWARANTGTATISLSK